MIGKRTHTCGELRASHIDQTVTLKGWVENRRDHGGVIFIDLRDRWGKTQVKFHPDKGPDFFSTAESLRIQAVVEVQGIVVARLDGNVNPKLATGEIEIDCEEVSILNDCETPPFEPSEYTDAGEEIRLKYRFLDLRRPPMQQNMILRSKAAYTIRDYFYQKGFIEVETPFLTKSTPEGARDFLVPSRVNPGMFYALPQSPQLFKQMIMAAGYDRYIQMVKCFRDEDLRADRQPEFTQIDVEMSFVDMEDIIEVIEGMVRRLWKECLDMDLETPFKRMPYLEAKERFGSDKPDLRFGMELVNVSHLVADCEFKVFTGTVEKGGRVSCIRAKGGADKFSRKDIDGLVKFVGDYGAKGLAWFKVEENGVNSPIAKFFPEDVSAGIVDAAGAGPGDILFFVADRTAVVQNALGALRCHLARRLDLIKENVFEFVWVVDAPLFEKDEETGKLTYVHHPFTIPRQADMNKLDTAPMEALSDSYDLVLNGVEIGGGSIRIHNETLQRRILEILGVSTEEMEEKFSFLFEGLRYGAPPHGGIAFGFDRLVMILCGEDSIRDVIAFPKTQKGQCLFTGAPSAVASAQLRDLGIKLRGAK